MALFDLSLDELYQYAPTVDEPADLDDFWAKTLGRARAHDLAPSFDPVDAGLRLVETYDVTFAGHGGQPVKAWLLLPASHEERLPCVVEYIGYGGGRGLVHERLLWPAAGYAYLAVDTRGQGSTTSVGDTPDPEPDGANPHHPGFMTRGVLDPETYYYRRVYTDAVRAVEAARAHPVVDRERIVVTGRSQGGGIAVAVAALAGGLAGVMPDVPFLCHFRRGAEITEKGPYPEITGYLKAHRDHVDRVFATLAYFDGVNLARRASAPALFSVALMDPICPPSTVFAAYNAYAARRDIRVYPFNEHEGGEAHHVREQLRFVRDLVS